MSIFSATESEISDAVESVRIMQWINDHYNVYGDICISGSKVHVKGDVALKDRWAYTLTDGFTFGHISGFFSLNTAYNITSLEGAPERCKQVYVICCPQLKSIQHCPICNTLEISDCPIESLKGCPRILEKLGIYHINISDLEGAPERCKSIFIFKCNELTSLKGIPTRSPHNMEIKNIYISECSYLKIIDDLPSQIASLTITQCYNLSDIRVFPKISEILDIRECPNIREDLIKKLKR